MAAFLQKKLRRVLDKCFKEALVESKRQEFMSQNPPEVCTYQVVTKTSCSLEHYFTVIVRKDVFEINAEAFGKV